MFQYRDGERRNGYIRRNGVWELEQAETPQSIQTRPADPVQPFRVQQAQADATRAGNQASASAYDAAIARANAERAAAEAQRAQIEASREARGEQREDDANLRRANLNSIAEQIIATESMFRGNIQGGAPQPIWGYVPTADHEAFNTAGRQLLEVGQSAFRIPGSGDQSRNEMQFKLDAYLPSATNTDARNREIFNFMRQRVDDSRRELGMDPIDWEGQISQRLAPPQMDRGERAVVQPNTRTQTQLSDGTIRVEEDPVLRGLGARIGRMLADGTPDRAILDELRAHNLSPSNTSIREVLRYRRSPDFRRWQQQNPGSAYPIGDSFWRREVRQNPDFISRNANSPYGAATVQFTNALMGNRLDDVVGATGGDADVARAGIAGLRSEYPLSSLGGDIAGMMATYSGVGRLAGAVPSIAARGAGTRAIMGDTAYGAYAGSGDDNTLAGAGAGAVGGVLGRGITRGAGALVGGTRDRAILDATARNIPLTVGQMAGQGGRVGQMVRGLEGQATSIPAVGSMISGQHRLGMEAGVRAAHQEALNPIGGTAANAIGEDAVDHTLGRIQDAFRNAVGGVTLTSDRAFGRQMAAVRRAAARPAMTAEVRGVADAALAQVDELFDGRNLSGQNFQAALQIIDEARSAVQRMPAGRAGASTLRQAERALIGMARRQAPEMVPALNRARAAYRRYGIVRDATRAAVNDADGMFTPGQLGLAMRQGTTNFGGRNASASANRPFHGLHDTMRQLLPNRVPDSGTGGRAAMMAAAASLTGGGAVSDQMGWTEDAARNAAMISALLAGPYTNTGRGFLQGAVARRPEAMRNIGDMIRESERLRRAGTLSGAGLLPYYGLEGY